MQKEAILHIPDSEYAFALNENTLVIRIRTKREDIKNCSLCYGDRVCMTNPIQISKLVMKRIATDQLFDYFECEFVSPYSRVCYYFELKDETDTLYYYGDEFYDKPASDRTKYYQYAYIHQADITEVPKWAKEAVIYQIFPDSFANGYRKIEQTFHAIDEVKNNGNLRGIIENLDYLIELGINCIYLNPVFQASSYHKYDTIDYFEIDSDFGTKEELKELVVKCHENGIRVILDGVFNHCGSEFPVFLDVLIKEQASKLLNWFYKLSFPIQFETPPNYEAFAYVKEMPKINTANTEVCDYFCRVGEYWIKEADIDGWRLDVANEINHDFWRAFRKRMKALKKDTLLIGEIWEDARQWLMGDQFDSTMNYRFSNVCRDYFAEHTINAYEFGEKLNAMLMRYKRPITYAQMNLLDSHDVPRFLTKCNGDLEKYKLAVMFMLTFVGMPSVFYGDELLIEGDTEREYRKPMPWNEKQKHSIYDYFKALIHIRKSYQAFTRGQIMLCNIYEDVFGFIRFHQEEKLLVLLNNSKKERRVDLSLYGRSHLGNLIYPKALKESEKIENVVMKPMQGVILTID
jgi:cyclomaltodextrinase